MTSDDWELVHRSGSAHDLHQVSCASDRRRLVINEVGTAALVLGSAQLEASVDTEAVDRAGLDLVRRRSGGGAVLLVPGQHLWFDVVVPAGDPFHDADVERATWWLGEVIRDALHDIVDAAAIARLGGLSMHHRGVSDRELGRVACFAAAGPGEVLLGSRKLVGISQRRTRDGERFQCIVHGEWDAARTSSLLVAPDPVALASALAEVATLADLGLDDPGRLIEALHSRLGSVGAG